MFILPILYSSRKVLYEHYKRLTINVIARFYDRNFCSISKFQ